ncbi:universal stress protein [Variovorax sp. WS11]|uniref:universal stress protein n=1 Tax=Variovorax sp. WS11 TaxID=1105204 RepID=UPI000D0D700C|nr:universal stress protein [Variovorax sp. WS11]NDZ18395.1 universal stress protein [Variovorax sp. WS11]PSL81690.1 universal stress protein [Variovorax sp. WS11]
MYRRILVPIDGSTTSLRGLDEALRLAKLTGAKLRLIHVVDELKYVTGFETFATYSGDLVPLMAEAGRQILEQGRERARRAGIKAESVLFTSLAGRVSEIVVEQARTWKAELIVIGTHGRHGVARALLGSDAEQVLRLAPVPVLLVNTRPDDGQASGAAASPAVAHA